MEAHITDYRQAHQVLCNPHLRQSLYDAGDVVMQGVLLTLHGRQHIERRHLALKVFKRDYARYYEREVFPPTLQSTLAPLREPPHRQESEPTIDAVAFGHAVSMNLTADFAGIDRDGDPQTTATLQRLTRTFGEGATLVHSTRDHTEVRHEVRAALNEYRELFLNPSIARRQSLIDAHNNGQLDETDLPRDMLTALLINITELQLDADGLAREIAFYLQAGSHSTANAFAHCLWELLTWIGDDSTRRTALVEDPLAMQLAVHEALRLHPASPVAWRQPLEALDFDWGLHVDTSDRLVVDIAAANRDPNVFGDDADVFRPSREVHDKRANRFGLTFGIGVHNCLGRDIDAGLPQSEDTIMANHQYGTVTLLTKHFIAELGATFDQDDPPTQDSETSRPNWGRLPVRMHW
jgi:cytochrome P450